MRSWGKGPPGGDSNPSDVQHVPVELDPEGPRGEPAERKKVSSVLFIRSAIMVSVNKWFHLSSLLCDILWGKAQAQFSIRCSFP